MIELLDYTVKLRNAPKCDDIEQAATRDRHRTTGLRFLEDEVTKIQKEPKLLTMFGYELRYLDTEDKVTHELLNGQVTPPALVDILE